MEGLVADIIIPKTFAWSFKVVIIISKYGNTLFAVNLRRLKKKINVGKK